MLDSPGSAFGVIISNPELRQGLIRDGYRSHRAARPTSSGRSLGAWLAHTFRRLASRTAPTPQIANPRPEPGGVVA
jgi:hypothetical protein